MWLSECIQKEFPSLMSIENSIGYLGERILQKKMSWLLRIEDMTACVSVSPRRNHPKSCVLEAAHCDEVIILRLHTFYVLKE